LVSLLFCTGAHSSARKVQDPEVPLSPFVSANETTSRAYVLTNTSTQPVARAASYNKLKHWPVQNGLVQSGPRFPPVNSRQFFASDFSASYSSFHVFSFGGRDPPAAI